LSRASAQSGNLKSSLPSTGGLARREAALQHQFRFLLEKTRLPDHLESNSLGSRETRSAFPTAVSQCGHESLFASGLVLSEVTSLVRPSRVSDQEVDGGEEIYVVNPEMNVQFTGGCCFPPRPVRTNRSRPVESAVARWSCHCTAQSNPAS